jgi:hypothetical protein
MPISPEEKRLLDLIAKYNFLDQCNATGILDRDTFDRLTFQMGAENMEKIQYYLQRLNEHHEDTREFLDRNKKDSDK